mmetsp:Transcript_22261/g.29812  ORF Transcript_22261/g.29812 Transcript_22261/m.29812 type:complete len:120 (+) Transcript_22261:3499-3858(+)
MISGNVMQRILVCSRRMRVIEMLEALSSGPKSESLVDSDPFGLRLILVCQIDDAPVFAGQDDALVHGQVHVAASTQILHLDAPAVVLMDGFFVTNATSLALADLFGHPGALYTHSHSKA